MSSDRLLVPEYFTSCDGGSWLQYTGNGFTLEILSRAVTGLPFTLIENSDVPFEDMLSLIARYGDRDYMIHSLAFSMPLPDAAFPRWDVYNGWTTPL